MRRLLTCLHGTALLIAIGGCAIEDPDPPGPAVVHYPGPCRAVTHGDDINQDTIYTWTYDELDRLIEMSEVDEYFEYEWANFRWTYAGADLVQIVGVHPDLGGGTATMQFAFGETVQMQFSDGDIFVTHKVGTYERAGFQLHGHPLYPQLDAPDSRLRVHTTVTETDLEGGPVVRSENEVTYTYSGPPRQGTRSQDGSDGSGATYTYDAEGRLLSASSTDLGEYTYQYDGDRMTSMQLGNEETTFVYDEQGNLLRMTRGDRVTEHFYDCW